MSLVICKNINNKIYIESDSRITDINAARKESIYGILKTIILHPKISISFAGNIYLAEKAIQEIFLHKKLTIDYLIETLLKYNKDNNNEVEFILCLISNNTSNEIIKISNSFVDRNLLTAWIGDINGFNVFQSQFHNLKESGINEAKALEQAFSSVIENQEITTVGDFQISTHTETSIEGNFMFQYTGKFGVYLNESQTFNATETKNTFNITWGSAAGGSFGISYFVSVSPNHYSVGIYFIHGNFGILFCPKLGFEGIVFSNISNLDFLKTINDKYKIPLRGFRMVENSMMQLVDMRFPDKI